MQKQITVSVGMKNSVQVERPKKKKKKNLFAVWCLALRGRHTRTCSPKVEYTDLRNATTDMVHKRQASLLIPSVTHKSHTSIPCLSCSPCDIKVTQGQLGRCCLLSPRRLNLCLERALVWRTDLGIVWCISLVLCIFAVLCIALYFVVLQSVFYHLGPWSGEQTWVLSGVFLLYFASLLYFALRYISLFCSLYFII